MIEHKEDKVINHSKGVLVQLHSLYNGGLLITEYDALLKEYEKLFKRYKKVIKMTDAIGNKVIHNSDNLQESLDYTIKAAREKLLYNVKEHRKTKENSQHNIEKIKQLEEEITLLKKGSPLLSNQIDSQKNEPIKEERINESNINPLEYKNSNISKIIKETIDKNEPNCIIMACIAIDNFDFILSGSGISTVETFLKSIYKYLKNSFGKNDIIFHSMNEKFYVISTSLEMNDFCLILEKINTKKSNGNFQIIFKSGITKFVEEDNIFSFLTRCNHALEEAKILKTVLNIKQ